MGDGLELLDRRADRVVVGVGGLGQRLAVDDVQRRVEQQQEAGAAGIDDAGVLQHRQQLGRAGQRMTARHRGRARSTVDSDTPSAAAAVAASADSRTTVRMVPSIGFSTASYAATDAAFSALATVAPDAPTRSRCPAASASRRGRAGSG